MQELFVVKIGGNVIDDENALNSFLSAFAAIPNPKILVHGGGKIATELSKKLDIQPQMIDGRRVTDPETLKVVVMVYAGLVNKTVVAKLQALNQPAVGLSGADANAIPATRRAVGAVDYGLVGDINPEMVNSGFICSLLEQQISPVFAPIAHDGRGQLLNVNADTIAASVAKALSTQFAVRLVYGFEKDGVLADPHDENSVISHINPSSYEQLKAQKVVAGGMLPKLDNAFDALRAGVGLVQIGNALQLNQLCLPNPTTGTAISL